MRLTIGFSKKIGLPGFGSAGATCQLESGKLPAGLSRDDFRRRVARAFAACRRAVEEELERHRPSPAQAKVPGAVGRLRPDDGPIGDGHTGSGPSEFSSRPATVRQLDALKALVAKRSLAPEELERLLGGASIDALTVAEASAAIGKLQAGGAPHAARRVAVNGSPKGGA
jgi:hypothetical protein